jgi:hypothetical protein
LSNTNPTKNQEWHPSCYTSCKPGDKSIGTIGSAASLLALVEILYNDVLLYLKMKIQIKIDVKKKEILFWFDIINILPLIEGVMVDYHTQKTNIIRDEVEGDIVVF